MQVLNLTISRRQPQVFFTMVAVLNEKKKKMEDSTRRANTNKRLHVNQRVSGALGEYIDGPTKCRCQNGILGT
jgi:hypothetical protein